MTRLNSRNPLPIPDDTNVVGTGGTAPACMSGKKNTIRRHQGVRNDLVYKSSLYQVFPALADERVRFQHHPSFSDHYALQPV